MELDKAEGSDLYTQSLMEAKLYQKVADECRDSNGACSVVGLVASAPVSSGADVMRRFLLELKRVAPMVRGVREAVWHKNVSYFVNQTYWDSLRVLADYNLSLDLLANRTQLAGVAKLAIALPELRINLDHIGYPNVKAAQLDSDWAIGMRSLAALPNVYIKLSGLPQAYGGSGWTAKTFQPYVSFVLKTFGPDRVNFAGNWFVLNEFGTYQSMLAAVMECLDADLNATAIQQVMAGTARSFYRLDDVTDTIKEIIV
jgi:L-fuconolactonase